MCIYIHMYTHIYMSSKIEDANEENETLMIIMLTFRIISYRKYTSRVRPKKLTYVSLRVRTIAHILVVGKNSLQKAPL